MQNQQQNLKHDLYVLTVHFYLAVLGGLALMGVYSAYVILAERIGVEPFEEMQTRAFCLLIMPALALAIVDCHRIGRLLGDPD